MSNNKTIPNKTLRIAIFDSDAAPDSRIYDCFDRFKFNENTQPYIGNVKCETNVDKFLREAENADLLFCDPGAFGDLQYMAPVKYKADEKVYKWLRDRPSKILYVWFLITPDYYKNIDTFTLPNVESLPMCETHWFVDRIVDEWLFNNAPLDMFTKEAIGSQQLSEYIDKASKQLLVAVAEKLGLCAKGKKQDIKKTVADYYHKRWELEMKRRGVKGF